MRYVMLCVFVSMVFIVGIWLFSVQDGVTTAARDIPATLQKGKDATSGAPSLKDLFEKAAPLRVEGQTQNGSEFFNQQLKGDSGASSGEGVALPPTK